MSSSTTVSAPKRKSKILFWSPECRYDVILNVVKQIGWRLVDDEKSENKINMFWIDIATIQGESVSSSPPQYQNEASLTASSRPNRAFSHDTALANDQPLSRYAQHCAQEPDGAKPQ